MIQPLFGATQLPPRPTSFPYGPTMKPIANVVGTLVLFFNAAAASALAQGGPQGAQPRMNLSVQTGYAFGSDLEDSSNRRLSDVDISHFGIAASNQYRLGAQTGLTLGLEYHRYDLDVNRDAAPLPESVEGVALQLQARHRIDDRWSLAGGIKPGLYASEDLTDGDACGLNVSAVALRRVSDEFTLAFGVIYRSMAESKYRVLPALGFDWRPAPNLAVSVGFPKSAVTYTFSERLRVSAHVSGQGGTYYVKDPVASTLSSLPALHDSKIDYTEIRVGFGADYRPVPALELSFSAGILVKQEFDYFERAYDLDAEDNAPYVGLSLQYSF